MFPYSHFLLPACFHLQVDFCHIPSLFLMWYPLRPFMAEQRDDRYLPPPQPQPLLQNRKVELDLQFRVPFKTTMMAVNMVLLVGGWTWTKLETPNFQNFLRNVWSPSKSIGSFFWNQAVEPPTFILGENQNQCWLQDHMRRDKQAIHGLFVSRIFSVWITTETPVLDLQGPWLIFLAPLATCFLEVTDGFVCDHPNISTWQVSPLPYLSWWTSSHSSLCLPCPQLDRLTTWKTVLPTHSTNICIYVWRVHWKFNGKRNNKFATC